MKYKINTLPKNIYTRKSFLNYLKVPKNIVNKILLDKQKYFKEFEKSIKGQKRPLLDCEKQYKHILRKINSLYLQKIYLPNFVHCGPKNRSTKTAARIHIKYNYHLKTDFKKYFPSIKSNLVLDALVYFHVPKNIAKFLCSFCLKDETLPQGYPTSPIISAIVTAYVLRDLRIYKDQVISFYVDDCCISSNFMRKNQDIYEILKNSIDKYGISLNLEKVRYGYKKYDLKDNSKFKFLGQTINDKSLTIDRGFINKTILNCFLLKRELNNNIDKNIFKKAIGLCNYCISNSNSKKVSKLKEYVILFKNVVK